MEPYKNATSYIKQIKHSRHRKNKDEFVIDVLRWAPTRDRDRDRDRDREIEIERERER